MPLSWNEIKSRALAFSRTWADAASEDSEAKPFWMAFFEIFGITDKRVATFELNVKKLGAAQGFVDLFWPGMLLVEHKSRGKDLNRAFAQALDYFPGLPERDLPQLIIVCDFARFRVHRLATGGKAGETVEFALADLHKHIKLFGFVAGYRVQEIKAQDPVNLKAAERMGRLHDALKASHYDGHPLEVLLVRLLFCLFADDTGIFQPAQAFRTFIEERTAPDGSDVGPRLVQLFQVLNTPEARRSPALDAQLASFPYLNGKLFAESLPMADFTAAILTDGTRTLDEEAFNARANDLAADIGSSSSDEGASIRLRSLSRADVLQPALKLVNQSLTEPRFDAEVFRRRQNQSVTALQQNETDPAFVADRAATLLDYPDHPYGSSARTSEQSLRAVTLADIRAFHRSRYGKNNAIVAVVGDIDRRQTEALVQTVLAGLPAKSSRSAAVPPVPERNAQRRDIPFAAEQAQIVMSMPLIRRDDPDYYALVVGNYILGSGGFDGRLMKTLRDEHGYVYGVSSNLMPQREKGRHDPQRPATEYHR